jgi:hypothetical protein
MASHGFGVTLDWSEPSVRQVEEILSRFHEDMAHAKPGDAAVWKVAKAFGSYVGEVMRRHHGCRRMEQEVSAMAKIAQKHPPLSRAEFIRRAQEYLREFQKALLPEHAQEFIAINVAKGEYVLGKTPHEAFTAFEERWPNDLMFRCRVDGGPSVKFHGM